MHTRTKSRHGECGVSVTWLALTVATALLTSCAQEQVTSAQGEKSRSFEQGAEEAVAVVMNGQPYIIDHNDTPRADRTSNRVDPVVVNCSFVSVTHLKMFEEAESTGQPLSGILRERYPRIIDLYSEQMGKVEGAAPAIIECYGDAELCAVLLPVVESKGKPRSYVLGFNYRMLTDIFERDSRCQESVVELP